MWYTVKIGPVVREANGLRTPPIHTIRPPKWLGLPEIFFEIIMKIYVNIYV